VATIWHKELIWQALSPNPGGCSRKDCVSVSAGGLFTKFETVT
jgi:hypothetical protein